MDCAKAVAGALQNRNSLLHRWKAHPESTKKASTSDRHSYHCRNRKWNNSCGVITDAETRYKYAINDFPLIPRYAVLDPKVTLSLPPFITATTGMDALTHAVEAYIGELYNTWYPKECTGCRTADLRKSGPCPIQTVRIRKLAKICSELLFCRLCFYQILCWICSCSCTYTLGGQYNVPHGLANASTSSICTGIIWRYDSFQTRPTCPDSRCCWQQYTWKRSRACFYPGSQRYEKNVSISGILYQKSKKKTFQNWLIMQDKEGNPSLYPVPVLMDAHELENFIIFSWTKTGGHFEWIRMTFINL